jgi:hypothetical protein
LSFPLASGIRFSRSIPKPVSSSCRLYTDCRRVRNQVSSRLIPELSLGPGFDSVLILTMRYLRFAFAHLLDTYMTSSSTPFPKSFTTTLFGRSSTGRFEINSCKSTSEGQLPSLVQDLGLAPGAVVTQCDNVSYDNYRLCFGAGGVFFSGILHCYLIAILHPRPPDSGQYGPNPTVLSWRAIRSISH